MSQDIHHTIAEIFSNRIAFNISRYKQLFSVNTTEVLDELQESVNFYEYFLNKTGDDRLRVLELWERVRWHELSPEDIEKINNTIANNKVQALVSPVKWIREWDVGVETLRNKKVRDQADCLKSLSDLHAIMIDDHDITTPVLPSQSKD